MMLKTRCVIKQSFGYIVPGVSCGNLRFAIDFRLLPAPILPVSKHSKVDLYIRHHIPYRGTSNLWRLSTTNEAMASRPFPSGPGFILI